MKYTFCPICAFRLETNKGEHEYTIVSQYCPACEFVHWRNPVPVAAVLIPFKSQWEPKTIPACSVLVVKRKAPPFAGHWCLPCGFMNCGERPKASARREVFEETGVHTRMERLIALCNPSPEGMELNQIIAFYLGKVNEEDPKPKAGDDASAVGVFYPLAKKVKNLTDNCYEDNKILCFSSHNLIVNDWMMGDIEKMGVNYELKYAK